MEPSPSPKPIPRTHIDTLIQIQEEANVILLETLKIEAHLTRLSVFFLAALEQIGQRANSSTGEAKLALLDALDDLKPMRQLMFGGQDPGGAEDEPGADAKG